MGEEEKRKGGEKEKEKEKEKMGDGDKGNKNKDKKDESPPIIILRTDLHCEGCAMKVKRAIRSLPGVDTVYADPASNRVTVTGPADPWEVKERMEAKTKRNVEFVSPANPPKKDKDKVGGDKKPGADSPKQPKKDAAAADDEKPKEPPESTVMLKIRLHCDGCIDRIERRIYKVKGVKEVTVDAAKDLITVKGTMDVNSLPSYLTEKLRRSVEMVPAAKKDGGGGGGGGGKEKEKEKKDGEAGSDKMKEEKKEEKAAAAPPPAEAAPPPAADVPPPAADVPPPAAPSAAEVNRYDYYGYPSYGYGYGYGYGYRVEIGHAPQIFSDENPNACAVM